MTDTLTAAMAMFSLKEPSLLAFQDRRDEPAIKKLFQLTEIPADSTMREILDGIEIDPLNEALADLSDSTSELSGIHRRVSETGVETKSLGSSPQPRASLRVRVVREAVAIDSAGGGDSAASAAVKPSASTRHGTRHWASGRNLVTGGLDSIGLSRSPQKARFAMPIGVAHQAGCPLQRRVTKMNPTPSTYFP